MFVLLAILPWFLVAAAAAIALAFRRQRDELAAANEKTRKAAASASLTLTRIRQAIATASDAIGIGDMTGSSLYHNPAHEALFGYSVEELNAVEGRGVLFADPLVAAAIHAAIRAGYSWAGETEIMTRDNRRVPCFVRSDVIRDEEGRPVGIFGVFTDITERLRTQHQLEEQRQRLELTLQSIGDAVIAVDAEGRVILINPVGVQFTGLSSEEAVGRPLAEVLRVLDETTREPRECGAARLLREAVDLRSSETFLLVGPNGIERLVAENAALIHSAKGEMAGAVLALRDITRERKRTDEAARANRLESMGLLAGGIAHDFGNLLTAMVGNLTLAQYVPGLPEAAVKRLAEVERGLWRARDVTQQLTGFAKGGAPKKKRVALPALLREATEYATAHSTVVPQFVFAPDLTTVEADEGQLVQVFNNLALNAVQAMPDGGTLQVSAKNFEPASSSASPTEGNWVIISVTDTGIGIAPENLSKIFDPFFTTKDKGTGFGLATSYSVVKKHGGQIRVESQVGLGTTFHITLPGSE